ncbi:hypothetical protein HYFRA_00005726 [Hymenoscyphus fraxineus]|uniref:RanBP2-type domain-containing protein n=1 Tax=Hymenoscyphus fraxineus TaxID=746836 RepID=A0A9N9PM45_9HELO|nr:hypothetical protein HYFRA_00005726 [Hymenoscyphus fraxineus]
MADHPQSALRSSLWEGGGWMCSNCEKDNWAGNGFCARCGRSRLSMLIAPLEVAQGGQLPQNGQFPQGSQLPQGGQLPQGSQPSEATASMATGREFGDHPRRGHRCTSHRWQQEGGWICSKCEMDNWLHEEFCIQCGDPQSPLSIVTPEMHLVDQQPDQPTIQQDKPLPEQNNQYRQHMRLESRMKATQPQPSEDDERVPSFSPSKYSSLSKDRLNSLIGQSDRWRQEGGWFCDTCGGYNWRNDKFCIHTVESGRCAKRLSRRILPAKGLCAPKPVVIKQEEVEVPGVMGDENAILRNDTARIQTLMNMADGGSGIALVADHTRGENDAIAVDHDDTRPMADAGIGTALFTTSAREEDDAASTDSLNGNCQIDPRYNTIKDTDTRANNMTGKSSTRYRNKRRSRKKAISRNNQPPKSISAKKTDTRANTTSIPIRKKSKGNTTSVNMDRSAELYPPSFTTLSKMLDSKAAAESPEERNRVRGPDSTISVESRENTPPPKRIRTNKPGTGTGVNIPSSATQQDTTSADDDKRKRQAEAYVEYKLNQSMESEKVMEEHLRHQYLATGSWRQLSERELTAADVTAILERQKSEKERSPEVARLEAEYNAAILKCYGKDS